MEKGTLKKLIVYCAVSLLIVGAILLNLGNEKFGKYFDRGNVSIQNEILAGLPGIYIDETAEYSGEVIRTGKFIMPNFGRYRLWINAETYSENHYIELWSDDGRSEELLLREMIPAGSGVTDFYFDAPADLKYAEVRVQFGGAGFLTVREFEVYSDAGFADTYFTAAFAGALLLLIGIYRFRKGRTALTDDGKEKLLHGALMLAAILFISQPTFLNYLNDGHDIHFHLPRIEAIKDSLLAGQIPTRVYPSGSDGYGYAAGIYYPDLFLHVPAVLRIIGCSQVFAVQVFFWIVNIGTALMMYYAANRIFKDRFTALMAALLYTTAFYRVTNIYTRFALGELIAMSFFPLIAAGLYEIFFGDRKKWWVAALGYSGVIQSHHISTMITVIFSLFFVLAFAVRLFREKRWLSLLKAAGTVLLFNLWFLLPFVQLYLADPLNISSQRVNSFMMSAYFAQIFDVFVSYPTAYSKGLDPVTGEMPQGLGLSMILSALLLLVWFILREKDRKFDRKERFSAGALVFALLAVWFASVHFPMRAVVESGGIGELINTVQYPWRLLGAATVFLSFLGAFAIAKIGRRINARWLVAFVMSLVMILPIGHYTNLFMHESIYYFTKSNPLEDTTGWYLEYLPKSFNILKEDGAPRELFVFDNPAVQVTEYSRTNEDGLVFSYSGGAAAAELPLTHYLGYTIKDQDGGTLDYSMSENGLIRVALPEESGTVTAKYTGFWYWKISDILSLSGIALFAAFAVIGAVNRRKKKYLPATPRDAEG